VEDVVFLEDGDVLHIHNQDYNVIAEGITTNRDIEKMDINALEISKGTYKHFMLKEIFEQPTIMRRVFKGRVNFEERLLNAEAFHGMHDEKFQKIVFIGCGTSYNAGCLGVQFMQDIAGIEAVSYIASEYAYQQQFVDDQTLFVFISQSGETADSIEVLKMLKEKNAHTFGIVNVVGSTISRLTDYGLFTRAGAEI
jgi:glucosamine--fructose-6-phosphate aminotransferase (isomerizing)